MSLKLRTSSSSLAAFTLVEIIVVLIMLTILVTLAIPSFQSMIKNNQSVSLTNELVSALNLTRSEAIKRGLSVSICAASDSSLTTCGTNWENGWLIFTNPNEDNTYANNTNEVLLKVQQITDTNISITTTPSLGIVTYQSTGFPLAANNNLAFSVKAIGCTSNNASTITINPTGRIASTPTAC